MLYCVYSYKYIMYMVLHKVLYSTAVMGFEHQIAVYLKQYNNIIILDVYYN